MKCLMIALIGLCMSFAQVAQADYCWGYYSSNGYYWPSKTCSLNLPYCCGTCSNRYCCSNYWSSLNQYTCSNNNAPVYTFQSVYIAYIVVSVVVFIIILVGTICAVKRHRARRILLSRPIINPATGVAITTYQTPNVTTTTTYNQAPPPYSAAVNPQQYPPIYSNFSSQQPQAPYDPYNQQKY